MNLEKIIHNGVPCALVTAGEVVIRDAQSALDVLISAKYDLGTKNILLGKALIAEDFFQLSTGLAGEILQKYVNYGDFSHYHSKPLRDFIYESNQGRDVFFVRTQAEALGLLTR